MITNYLCPKCYCRLNLNKEMDFECIYCRKIFKSDFVEKHCRTLGQRTKELRLLWKGKKKKKTMI